MATTFADKRGNDNEPMASAPAKRNHLPVSCFAPELTDEKLVEYRGIVSGLPSGELKDALSQCLACVERWRTLPKSKETGPKVSVKHRGQNRDVHLVPMGKEKIEQLHDVTPWLNDLNTWDRELASLLPDGTREVPATIETEKGLSHITKGEVVDANAFALKTCAKHLIWLAMEITLDREPLTQAALK